MTADDLPRTPEGELIRRARDRAVPKLSIRAAAARIGISPEHWGNVERGYKAMGARFQPQPLEVSAVLLAKMAVAVAVTPDELAKAGREDAARELEEIQSRDGTPRTRVTRALEADVSLQPYLDILEMERAAGIPPRSPGEQRIWDSQRYSEQAKRNLIAMIRQLDDDSVRESQRGTGLGRPRLAVTGNGPEMTG